MAYWETNARRVVLAAIVVGAALVAGGSTADAEHPGLGAPSSGNAEANVTSGETLWRNQSLRFQARHPDRDAGKIYQVRTIVEGEVDALQTEFVLNERGVVTLRTTDMPPGRYVIVDETGRPLQVGSDGESRGPAAVANASWELAEQTLSTTMEPDHVVQNGTTTLRLGSNRGRYQVRVSSPDAAVDTLVTLLGGHPIDTNGDGQPDAVLLSATARGMRTVRAPDDIPPGSYRLRFAVPDTDVTASATVQIRERPRVRAHFGTLAVQENRGDIVSLEVRLNRTRTAIIWIGSHDQGYLTRLRVVDGNGDGVVTVQMNTYQTGRVSRTAEEKAFGTRSKPDRVTNVTRLTARRDAPIAAGEYPINATVEGRQTGGATLVLTNRTSPAATTLVAPGDAETDTLGTLTDVATERRVVALDDKIAIRVAASGLGGFFNASYDLSRGSVDARTHGLYLTIQHQNESSGFSEFDITRATLVVAPGAEMFYVVFDTGTVDVVSGETYNVRLIETGSSPFRSGEAEIVANTTFRLVERRATFNRDRRVDDAIAVSPRDVTTISLSGSSTVAPGTKLLVTLRSDGEPFLFANDTVTVQSDGGWAALFEFERFPESGTRFTAKVRDGGRIISKRADVVVKMPTPLPTETPSESGIRTDILFFLGILVVVGAVSVYLYRSG